MSGSPNTLCKEMVMRHTILSVLVLGLAFVGGCDSAWEKKIEPTPETRSNFMGATSELLKIRGEQQGIAIAARQAVKERKEDVFQQRLLDLRQNFEKQIALMETAEANASTKEIRKQISAEKERTTFDLRQLEEFEKIWRNEIEVAAWREISWK